MVAFSIVSSTVFVVVTLPARALAHLQRSAGGRLLSLWYESTISILQSIDLTGECLVGWDVVWQPGWPCRWREHGRPWGLWSRQRGESRSSPEATCRCCRPTSICFI